MRKHRLWSAASHGTIVLGIAFTVLFVIDRFNPSMDFLGSEQSDWLLLLFCIFSLTDGVMSAASLIRRRKAQYSREHPERKHESE